MLYREAEYPKGFIHYGKLDNFTNIKDNAGRYIKKR